MSSRISVGVKWNGHNVDLVRAGAVAGVQDAIDYLLNKANEMVPHDEGTLQTSGATSMDTTKIVGQVSYDTPYAVRLHEHPEYRFQKGRRGKWLEQAFDRYGPHAMKIVRGTIKRKVGDSSAD